MWFWGTKKPCMYMGFFLDEGSWALGSRLCGSTWIYPRYLNWSNSSLKLSNITVYTGLQLFFSNRSEFPVMALKAGCRLQMKDTKYGIVPAPVSRNGWLLVHSFA